MSEYPYIPAAHTSGPQSEITRLVVHSTTGSSACGSARHTAHYFQEESSGGSSHYVVDACEIIQCVRDNIVAWGAPPNHGELHVELCDNPGRDEQHKAPITRWDDGDHKKVFDRAIPLVAELCKRHGVPVRKLSTDEVRAGGRGICGHINVSRAFHESTHWDPGNFPWAQFIAAVRETQGGGDKPPTHTGGTDDAEWTDRLLKTLPTLRRGDATLHPPLMVQRVQGLCRALGHHIAIDGDYGPATEAAVRAIQKGHDLVADGVVGEATWGALVAARKG